MLLAVMLRHSHSILAAVLPVIFLTRAIATSNATTGADYNIASRTVQFAVSPLLNARVVTTLSESKLVTWNQGIDGTWSGLATRSAAESMGSKGVIALPDNGTFSSIYLDVRLDGAAPQFVPVPKGDSDLALAQDLAASEHRVEIFKRVESTVGILEVMSLAVVGEFLPATPLPPRRLMFLGDSFTAGQATTVEDDGPMDPSKAMRQNARLCYGRLLADRLHAQSHIIAYAGRGVMRDWQGVRAVRCAPEYYEPESGYGGSAQDFTFIALEQTPKAQYTN